MYRISVKVQSKNRHNDGLCPSQSDIVDSDIRLSQISSFTDIGQNAHLCLKALSNLVDGLLEVSD
jgi:hypothetical protein